MKPKFLCVVYKMGNKLGTYFSKDVTKSIKVRKGELVNFTFIRRKRSIEYITRFSNIISFRKEIITFFNLHKGNQLYFRVEIVPRKKKIPMIIFQTNKIDLLKLIPEKTTKGSCIVLNPFFKGNEAWVRLWSCHYRGSSQQIEIRRFVDPILFGKLIGQIQSEGTKNGDGKRLEFSNKSIKEHKDFIFYLNYLGIPHSKIFVKFNYFPKVKNADNEIRKFENSIGIKVNYRYLNPKSKGSFGFHTFVRSTLFYSIIISSMDIIRKLLVKNKWDKNLRLLADGFFSKILSGDGSIEVITKNRNVPQGRIKITDGNFDYLKDYKEIMKQYGFKPKINKRFYYVRSYLNLNLAKTLLSIGAFEGNHNKDKLEFLIKAKDFANRQSLLFGKRIKS